MEKRIVYEGKRFYAFQISPGHYEIRKNDGTHSTVIGVVSTIEQATRFIDRADKYPDRF